MKTTVITTALIATLGLGAAANAMDAITEADVQAAQQAWGEGIVTIGEAFSEGEDYTEAAQEHIERFYAYGSHPVLFKPTLAADEPDDTDGFDVSRITQ